MRRTIKRRPATPEVEFTNSTSLCLSVIAKNALDHAMSRMSPHALPSKHTFAQQEWFMQHVDLRIRWLHANDEAFRKSMNGHTNADRDRAIMFARHWAKAFLDDPDYYQRKHPDESMQ